MVFLFVNCHVRYKTIIVKFVCSKAKVVLFSISIVTCVLFDYTLCFLGTNVISESFYITYKIFYAELQSVSTV